MTSIGGNAFAVNLSVGGTAGTFYYNTTYVNDTFGNLASNTSILSVTVNTPVDNLPQWFDNSSNSTTAGANVLHSARWTDDTALSGYIFSFDNGNGTFPNVRCVVLSGEDDCG